MTAVTYTATEGLDLQGTEVGAWMAETTAGTASGAGVSNDLSATGIDLDATGALTKTAVATGAGLVSYSGWSTSNYLSRVYGADLDITDQLTMCAWVKLSSVGTYQVICGNLNQTSGDIGGYVLQVDAAGNAHFVTISDVAGGYAAVVSTSSLLVDKWYFIVAVVAADGVLYLYINGVLSATAAAYIIGASTTPFTVGVGYDAGAQVNPFSGSIAGVRVINGVLTAAQILNIYNREKSLFQNYAPYRQIGTSYSLDIKASSITRSESPVSNSVRSLGGAQETIFIRRDTNYACAFTDIHITELPAIRNFIHSIEAGETFTFDAYGNTTTADNPLSVIADPGYNEPRLEFSDYFVFSLNVREV